ncbi:Hypothetical predicted protein [Octopus vulgaris]|uniref:Uncharacterized protein n=1 Tax=Octopus vulgaris TaxID=6645 RepID=A0AA36FH85_OCTVU|nr:Hypothetical predicted protein [Octopus vulgaris]
MQTKAYPLDFMADFEAAVHEAFNSSFPNSSIVAGLFHLNQSVFRKIIDLSLKEKDYKDSEFCLKTRCFSAMAFLPVEDVEEVYGELKDDEEVPAEFIANFDLTYIEVVRGCGARQRRGPPTFPITVWNVNQRMLQDLPRTNNAAVGEWFIL